MSSGPSALPINDYEDNIGKFHKEEAERSPEIQIDKETEETFSEEAEEPIDDFDSDSEDIQLPDNITYSISHADPLCIKFNELLEKGVIERSPILYKHINDVVEIFSDRFHKYDDDVLEFFNTTAYLGGRSTVNFIRGPMCYRKGQRGVATNIFKSIINLGGPLEPTRAKKQAGYSTSSGVIKLLSLCQLKLSTYQRDVSTFFIYNDLVGVVPSVLSNYDNALKPAIEFDLYKK